MLEIVNERSATRQEWLDVCRACAYATFFHTPLWAEFYTRSVGPWFRPEARLIVFNDGVKVIISLSRRRIMGFFTEWISSPASNYGGWISTSVLSAEHELGLIDRMKRFSGIQWRENPYDPILGGLQIHGAREDFTQTVDLRCGFDAAFHRWSRGHIGAVNKAQKAGVTVRQATSMDDWQRHYQSYRKLRNHWKYSSSNYKWSLFNSLAMSKSPHVVLWLAEFGQELLSSVVCFYWNKHAVAWHSAAEAERFGIRSNHFMYYKIIKQAAKDGYAWFDMNPSGGLEGVMQFKTHLGCTKIRSRVVYKQRFALRIVRSAAALLTGRIFKGH